MEKKLDKKGRWRNKTTSFMMSPEERAELDMRISLTGLTKQEYMVRRLLERDIIVQPSSRTFKALRDLMLQILSELKRIESGGDIDDELREIIKTVAETYNGSAEKKMP